MSKILVVGFDGATFDLIKPWVEKGKLPTFKKFMERGVWTRLRSTISPSSEQAWSSFMTGKNNGKHGIYGFTKRKRDSYKFELINGSFRRGKSLWKLLSENGKKVGVINVPMTYPPERVNGFLIGGLFSSGVHSNFTHPLGLYKEIKKHVGDYIIETAQPRIDPTKEQKVAGRFVKEIYKQIEKRFKTAEYFLKSRQWDFFMVVFTATDRIQHMFWKHMNKKGNRFSKVILNTYKMMDNILAKLERTVGNDVKIYIVSDHGFGRLKAGIYLNRWLAKEGLLKVKEDICFKLPRKLMFKLASVFIKGNIKRIMPKIKRTMPKLVGNIASSVSYSNINWSATKAYAVSGGNICINLKGREPKGIIESRAEYEELRERIIQSLKELRNPADGAKVIEGVYRREDIYKGKFLHEAPDIIVHLNDEYRHILFGESINKGKVVVPTDEEKIFMSGASGTHTMEGIFIANGKDIKKGTRIKGAKIIDAAPTILYSMKVPIPEDMDGKVLTEIFEKDFLERNPIRHEEIGSQEEKKANKAYSVEDKEKIEERLKGLGYIE